MIVNPYNYTDEQINNALRAPDGSRKISFRYDLLNRMDNKIGELEGIEQARVTYGESQTVKRMAAFTHNEHFRRRDIDFLSDRIQPWFILYMDEGGTVEWPLGIFLMESPDRNVDGSVKRRNIGAYDKTLILDQYRLTHRLFFGKGTGYIAAVGQLLSMAGLAKTRIEECGLEFYADREFPIGTKAGEAINELLGEINYTGLSVDETGCAHAGPYIFPAKRPPTKHYTADNRSVILPGFTDTLDIAPRANVFIRVSESFDLDAPLVSEFVNDNPQSPLSTVRRGRAIVDFDKINDIANQEALDNLVHRIAIESTSAYRQIEFTTLLMPNHGSAETLYIDIPELLEYPAKFTETGWEMELKAGGRMKHKARAVVHL